MSRENVAEVRTSDVRGLMVFQPHAAMIALGLKTLETRDWMPSPDSGVPDCGHGRGVHAHVVY